MAALNDLIGQITDPDLRARIQTEVNRLNKQKKFGLVWEEHIPEATAMYDVPVKRNRWVMKRGGDIKELFFVKKVQDGTAECVKRDSQETESLPVDSLVCVAQFGEPIYPYLKPVDSVCNAPDSDLWHTLIEADNYHALQLLEYLYAGKVDCIYIDPPYNTGAKDWKYNNNYVDDSDSYRHSKWLSMMEKRLKLAKKLLNPKDSVLIVTIDEKEYLHLGCLLEEMFPEARIQMVTNIINHAGSPRKGMFARAEEYLFCIFVGDAALVPTDNDMLNPIQERVGEYYHLIRNGTNGMMKGGSRLFYPIYFREKDGTYHSIGEPLTIDQDYKAVMPPDGCFAVWPVNPTKGTKATWGLAPETFLEKLSKGYVKFGKWKQGSKTRTPYFIQSGTEKAISDGLVEVIGRDDEGAVILGKSHLPIRPLTVWNQTSHDASNYGSVMINNIFKDIRFVYPKALYAVKDTLNFFVANKPNALILDFFAGSGTTLHAVNLLNAEDGGHRRCILVTNNEVSNDEATTLSKQGYHPGDPEWEKYGIAHYVTWPRTVCSIEGHDINGQPLKGNYIGSELPMADGFKANAAFFELGFLDKTEVSTGKQFKEMLPVLWMKAGAHGKCPDTEEINPDYMILPENHLAILNNPAKYVEFAEAVNMDEKIEIVFIVTGNDWMYRDMIAGLDVKETYQLYRDYLDNFRINSGR